MRAPNASFGECTLARSSSREVRISIRVLFFFPVVYFSRGTLPPKTGKRALLGGPS